MGGRCSTDTGSVEVTEISRADQEAALDQEAQELLNISGEEFARRWHAGQYTDSDDARVTQVAMLLPDAW